MTKTGTQRGWTAFLGACALAALAVPAAAQDYKLTILHTSDVLSRYEPVLADGTTCTAEQRAGDDCFGGAARLAGRIKLERAAVRNVLIVDAGNMFTGSNFWTTHKQRAAVELMNKSGFDAMQVGHTEFAEGSEPLGQFVQKTHFPLLGANINVERDPYLKDLIFPILITERGGERFGLIGMGAEDTPRVSKPSDRTRFDKLDTALPFWLRILAAQKIDKVIAISYAGFDRDKQIAQSLTGIDVIIGGNSKDYQPGPGKGDPTVLKAPNGHTVLVAQTPGYGRYLGKLDVTFGRDGGLKKWKGEQLALDRKTPEDPDVRATVDQLVAEMGTPAPAKTQ